MALHSEFISADKCNPTICRAWDALAKRAADPNPFYEHWSLLPALKYLNRDDVRLLFIWSDTSMTTLVGCFPLEICLRFRSVPMAHIRLWRHPFCYLCTPLIDLDHTTNVLETALDCIRSTSDIPDFIAFNWLPAGSSVNLSCENKSTNFNATVSASSEVNRAALNLNNSTQDKYLARLSKRKRKEWARLWRRFNDLGNVDSRILDADSTPDEFAISIDSFLNLEHAGWKSEEGTSLLSDSNSADYFRSMLIAGHSSGQALILEISLDGQSVGMITAVVSADRQSVYTLKIATDPAFNKFSIGSHIIMQLTDRLHHLPKIQYADSCATENHPMINWLWPDKQKLQSVFAPNGNQLARLTVSITEQTTPLLKLYRKHTSGKSRQHPAP